MRVLLTLSAALTVSAAVAASDTLEFLAALDDYPAIRATRSVVAAADVQLDAIRSPVSATAAGGYARFSQDVPDWYHDLPEEIRELLGLTEARTASQLELTVTLRPFLWGDLADAEAQLELERARQLATYHETRARLEVQAIESSQRLSILQVALDLAERGVALAEEVLDITGMRLERGAASSADYRQAEARLRDAEAQAEQAERDAQLSQAALTDLVGDARPPKDVVIPKITGTPLGVERARLDLASAEIGVASARRDLYPVVQAGYSYNADGPGSLSVGIESRTLQPTVSYRYQDEPAGIPGVQARSSFQVGVSLELSDSNFASHDAARHQLEAAAAGLELAERSAALELQGLHGQSEQARRQLALAEHALSDASKQLEEVTSRVELGISTSLERDQAALERDRAAVELAFAELEVTSSILAYYVFYGVPVSTVLEQAEVEP